MKACYWILSFLCFCSALTAAEPDAFVKELFEQGVTVDLKNPEFESGVLRTSEGGVVTGKDIRIQAEKITYTKQGEQTHTLLAEGNLRVDYGTYTLVGDSIAYDFVHGIGIIFNGRSGSPPWYFGGDEIYLYYNGELEVYNGYITTSESIHPAWEIKTKRIFLDQNHYVMARNIQFRFFNTSIFWLPSFRTNIDTIIDNPIRYRIRYSGKQGVRLGMTYQVINWDTFRANLRFDYRINRGPGFGVETYYLSPDCRQSFKTINYIANDPSIERPNSLTRYRMEGIYYYNIIDNHLTIRGSYDKLSDKYMARDYYDRGLDLKTAHRTYFNIRGQIDNLLVTNLATQLRVNDFQTVKQELPVLNTTLHPISIGNTRIIAEGFLKLGVLDFKYADDVTDIPDYNAVRVQLGSHYYRPIHSGPFTITPEAGHLMMYYTKSQNLGEQLLNVADLSTEIKTGLYRNYGCISHTFEPYSAYHFISSPISDPDQHDIFDISDGIWKLNLMKFGFRNLLYCNLPNCRFMPTLVADTYSYAFFDTPTIKRTIPRYYFDVSWHPYSNLRHKLSSAWDAERGIIDHFNLRMEWTATPKLAIAAEYRHRSAWAWRKSDYSDFILDSFVNEQALRDSLLSDRRDTLLLHIFYRYNPSLAFQFRQRHGWGRRDNQPDTSEPNYTESEFDTLINLPGAWNMRFSYRNKENEHRVAVYFSLGIDKP